MARPAPTPTTERLYARLPEHYRTADARQTGPDWPLLRFLSLVGDQAGELEQLLDRIDYVPPRDGGDAGDTSDLVDPDAADAGWLGWLGQLVGVIVDPTDPVATQRDAIAGARTDRWPRGSRGHLRAAIKALLSGDKFVRIVSHHDGPWVVRIEYLDDEAPDATWAELEEDFPTWADIEEADTWLGFTSEDVFVITQQLRPAGVDFHLTPYSATWADLHAGAPLAEDWNAAPTWRDLMQTAPAFIT